ncbi:MAG: hypothetical protein JWP01_3528 [Myxococcales bacterium]|nr:hypothetical protein [Myxococcales bacterium]
MTRTLALILSATLGAACAASNESVEFAASDPNARQPPGLVVIAPEVEVALGASEPVFRANNAYWLYRADGWYRSADLFGPWRRIATPPPALARIERPESYANYQLDHRPGTSPSATAQRDARDMQSEPAPREPMPQEPAPYANPRPPQQQPPVMPNDPGTTDRVPQDPTLPSQPGPDESSTAPAQPPQPEPDEQSRPDIMRDR